MVNLRRRTEPPYSGAAAGRSGSPSLPGFQVSPITDHYAGYRYDDKRIRGFGHSFLSRLVTQMYFPGDPLLDYDPMYTCIADERARRRLVSTFDWETTVPEYALGYRFDVVLRGRDATPMENRR